MNEEIEKNINNANTLIDAFKTIIRVPVPPETDLPKHITEMLPKSGVDTFHAKWTVPDHFLDLIKPSVFPYDKKEYGSNFDQLTESLEYIQKCNNENRLSTSDDMLNNHIKNIFKPLTNISHQLIEDGGHHTRHDHDKRSEHDNNMMDREKDVLALFIAGIGVAIREVKRNVANESIGRASGERSVS